MYRKEKCLSLLEDPEENGLENKYEDDAGRKTRLKWHKVCSFLTKATGRVWSYLNTLTLRHIDFMLCFFAWM